MGWELMQAPAPPGAQVLAAHPCATWPRVMGRQTGPEMKTRGKRTTACPQPLQLRLRPRAASGWLTLVPGKRPGSLVQVTGCRPTPRGTLRACFFLREQGYMSAAQPPPPSDLGPVCALCQDVGPAKEANACLSVCLSVCPSVLTFSFPLFLLLFPNWPFR